MYKDILLPLDLSDEHTWTRALPTAVEYAKAFGSVLHVMTVVPSFGMALVGNFFPADFEKQALDAATEALHSFTKDHIPSELAVQHVVAHGTVYEEILRSAGKVNADLIVLGAHRPELRDYLLGPNAARVVRHAKQSVLVVRD